MRLTITENVLFSRTFPLLIIGLFFFVLPVKAFGFYGQINTEVKLGGEYIEENKDSLLNPDEDLVTIFNYQGRLSAIFDTSISFSDHIDSVIKNTVLVVGKDAEGNSGSEINTYNYINDFYLNFRIADSTIFSTGIINHSGGIAYAFNPLDLFVPDYRFTSERIQDLFGSEKDVPTLKKRREGLLSARLESFFEFGAIKFAYAPYISKWADNKNFYANGYNQADYYFLGFTSNLFSDVNPEIVFFRKQPRQTGEKDLSVFGMSFSKAVGDYVIIQFEGTLQRGSEVSIIDEEKKGGSGASEPETMGRRAYRFVPRDQGGYFLKAVPGINIATKYRFELLLEYFFNGEGYDSQEMALYFNSLKQYNDLYLNSADAVRKTKAILSMNDTLDRVNLGQLARHYLFVRPEFKDVLLSDLDFSVNWVVNLIDESSLLSPQLDYKINDNWLLSVNSNHYFGSRDTEFGHLLNQFEFFGYISFFL